MIQRGDDRFMAPAAQSIQAAVHRVIAKASLSNELKVAFVKVVVVLISSILDVLVFFFPQRLIGEASVPPTVAIISIGACFIYTGFLIALRQPSAWRWLPKLQIVIPLFDSLLIALFITNISSVLGDSQPQIITNIAAFCCLLAVFGAPKVLDNHADKAVQAAQKILSEVKQLSPLPIGIGLHSGSIVAGCLGTDGHLEFSVIGDTVNVASRLESLTKEVDSSLLISKATQQRLKSLSLQSLGELPIRGRDEHIEVFVLPPS
ncbi:MAG: adenylate/guanylate cyclase domain-containing protein [Cyanobacteria bacterium J06627_3]